MRVSTSSTGLQVRAGVLSELKRRGARKKLQRLCYLGKDLKDDDVVGAVQKNAPSPWGYAHTVVCMCLPRTREMRQQLRKRMQFSPGKRMQLSPGSPPSSVRRWRSYYLCRKKLQ